MCALGNGLTDRHNRLRDWACSTYSTCTGLPAVTEQRVPEWDLVDDATGDIQEAILDVATSHALTGARLFFDVTVRCAYSSDPSRLGARARRNGRAAADGACAKRRRYATAGGSLIPLAFEAGGRPADETVAFLRQCGSAWAASNATEDGFAPSPITARLWQEVSTLLQLGNAELLLSAIGK